MLKGFSLLLVFQLLGEMLVYWVGLPLPGPVLGMTLLFALLLIKPALLDDSLNQAARTLIRYLTLLFLPAGIGIMVHWSRLQSQGFALISAVIISTLLGLIVSGWVLSKLIKSESAGADND
ncbi:CidA/LrgA family protein [Pelagibaculum spongiae]|uniref:Murein hydrolase regulator LrgA n=1 Tax=Pelagibaculum spongiae TaxID=2080658 RepID=A0A2V1GWK5_9GAMM|nr:CidA/LrgA family protein [Pelagibaculum spongiae]PVZ68328.1 murein hydrolase regulator LrgA [Pelagibaculum spongiae]